MESGESGVVVVLAYKNGAVHYRHIDMFERGEGEASGIVDDDARGK